MAFNIQSSSVPDFNYQQVRQEYAASFSLSLVPHLPFLHPLYSFILAQVRKSALTVWRPYRLHTGIFYVWEYNIV